MASNNDIFKRKDCTRQNCLSLKEDSKDSKILERTRIGYKPRSRDTASLLNTRTCSIAVHGAAVKSLHYECLF